MRECSPPIMCHMSHVTYHISHITYHMSQVTCHMPHVTSQMSSVSFFFLFFLQSGGASWWSVWYQRGLPCLVL